MVEKFITSHLARLILGVQRDMSKTIKPHLLLTARTPPVPPDPTCSEVPQEHFKNQFIFW